MNPRAAWPDFSLYRPHPPAASLIDWVADARAKTQAWLGDLEGAAVLGPRDVLLNPPQWEVGHLAWFWEKWLLRDGGVTPSGLLAHTDALYDSAAVAHATRWDIALIPWDATWAYLDDVLARVRKHLSDEPLTDELAYFTQLCVFHHDMHNEAFAIRRQYLGDMPHDAAISALQRKPGTSMPANHDIAFAPGSRTHGARSGTGFVFDNEKWAHEIHHEAFAIAARVVTQTEFAAFVDAGGYARREFWDVEGWRWREQSSAAHPLTWRHGSAGWACRFFDRWHALSPALPMMHVNAFEAQAWCAWAGRRLPTETEWEAAYPRLADHGSVWEWTATPFAPYAGFSADPYAEYSAPWFGGAYRVLRGGSVATSPRNIRRTWRNFYAPARSDMFCGFRTCAPTHPRPDIGAPLGAIRPVADA